MDDSGVVSDRGPALFSRKYVVFLDLLGFSELVRQSETEPAERERLLAALQTVRDTLCFSPSLDLRFTYFSDCIVISSAATPEALWQVFQSVEILICNLLQNDILVRGGMTVGSTFHDADFVFGTAVTEAYRLESREAVHPLVLLSPEVVEDVNHLGANFQFWMKEDERGRQFLHYLVRYSEYTSLTLS